MTTTTSTATRITYPNDTVETFGPTAAGWKFASFYSTPDGHYVVRYHRTEAQAARGQWDSAKQRAALPYAGYCALEHL